MIRILIKSTFICVLFAFNCSSPLLNKNNIKTNTSLRGCLQYYAFANQGYCFYKSGDIDSAAIYYSKAFEVRKEGCNVTPKRNDQFIFAKCHLKKGNETQAKYYLEEAIKRGGLTKEQILEDSILNLFNQSNYAEDIITSHDSLKAIWEKKLNKSLRDEVKLMAEKDQLYRDTKEYAPVDSLKKWQKEIDFYNEKRLSEIIKNYGFPGYNQIGSTSANIILLHTTKEFRDSIFTILYEDIDKGFINPSVVGGMIDQMMFLTDKQQRYGSLFKRNSLGYREYLDFEFDNIDSINVKRKSLGITSLECHSMEYEIELPYFFGKFNH